MTRLIQSRSPIFDGEDFGVTMQGLDCSPKPNTITRPPANQLGDQPGA